MTNPTTGQSVPLKLDSVNRSGQRRGGVEYFRVFIAKRSGRWGLINNAPRVLPEHRALGALRDRQPFRVDQALWILSTTQAQPLNNQTDSGEPPLEILSQLAPIRCCPHVQRSQNEECARRLPPRAAWFAIVGVQVPSWQQTLYLLVR